MAGTKEGKTQILNQPTNRGQFVTKLLSRAETGQAQTYLYGLSRSQKDWVAKRSDTTKEKEFKKPHPRE